VKLWRISNHCDLNGMGGERTDGRWHTAARGKRVVYLSEHPALALIETLANLKGNPALFPDNYQLLTVGVDEGLIGQNQYAAGPDGRIPEQTASMSWTQREGDAWLQGGESAFLAIPSFPAPFSLNYLFNPLHPDAGKVKIESCHQIEYDKRLFHLQK
jgi:RES domain-containing protein